MEISLKLANHPGFKVTDVKFLLGRGKTEAEIIKLWDEQLKQGKIPTSIKRPIGLKAI